MNTFYIEINNSFKMVNLSFNLFTNKTLECLTENLKSII